jgi:pimeloyl-ACP methyl ester carboxylesterase
MGRRTRHPCCGVTAARVAEPDLAAGAAEQAGLRLVAIDRPGYGRSTPHPGRTIAGWVPEGLAVADHLGIDRFVSVGNSTGGAYALALASLSDRVIAAVACCAVTDMRWPPGRAAMPREQTVWNARTRDEALAIVAASFGPDGSKISPAALRDLLPPSDAELLADPTVAAIWQRWTREWIAHGAAGRRPARGRPRMGDVRRPRHHLPRRRSARKRG